MKTRELPTIRKANHFEPEKYRQNGKNLFNHLKHTRSSNTMEVETGRFGNGQVIHWTLTWLSTHFSSQGGNWRKNAIKTNNENKLLRKPRKAPQKNNANIWWALLGYTTKYSGLFTSVSLLLLSFKLWGNPRKLKLKFRFIIYEIHLLFSKIKYQRWISPNTFVA